MLAPDIVGLRIDEPWFVRALETAARHRGGSLADPTLAVRIGSAPDAIADLQPPIILRRGWPRPLRTSLDRTLECRRLCPSAPSPPPLPLALPIDNADRIRSVVIHVGYSRDRLGSQWTSALSCWTSRSAPWLQRWRTPRLGTNDPRLRDVRRLDRFGHRPHCALSPAIVRLPARTAAGRPLHGDNDETEGPTSPTPPRLASRPCAPSDRAATPVA